MPRPLSDVWIHFISASVEGKAMYICKYCGNSYVKNATKMQKHISKCPEFPQSLKQATPPVTEPPKKKAKKDHIAESIGDEEAFHIQDEREYEERLRREAREEQKEERASLMSMWKEMMEFQGNLLKEFIHHPSRPASGPYHKHAHYNQGSSSFASTSYTAPYDSPGMETENESAISQEEEEEKYLPSEIPVIVDVASLKRTNDDQSNITLPLSPQPTQSTEETDLQMSVLRRQEKVLQLQEEYYTIKIKYLKDQMARDQGQIIKC
ncbi:uncharacterized protein si:dkey-6e2.2 isoform X2 [Triplophysa rosa]|uniref:uncharacterized protein si:dkey-6e2.2 isoform X2 n=1 Tax=Triplophysa rosa TaxID=992332 RepID=UPI002545FCAE|nr:uncharacterized protein si:dkey-6e2.2 isoform X2 [Triplophysa rosa]XP_057194537.1 uncharacterized protein si:dkey-6e2.2 isoform X2 [Triplophysa rosa]